MNQAIKIKKQIVFFRETSSQHFPSKDRTFVTHGFATNFRFDYHHDPVKQYYDKRKELEGKQDSASKSGQSHSVETEKGDKPSSSSPDDPTNHYHADKQITYRKHNETGSLIADLTLEKSIDNRYPSEAFFTECPRIHTKEQYDSQNWRNLLAKQILSEYDPNHAEIGIIPFYAITASRADLHPTSYDCTHYCHTPMLWLPVIQQMTIQLEERFSKNVL
jgi:hypothetical protein